MSSSTEVYELIVQKIPEKREILGNKVILPSEMLEKYSESDLFSYPLTFELKFNDKTVHCGVLEFTSNNNHIQLSSHVISNLEVNEEEIISVKYCELPKATRVCIDCKTTSEISESELQTAIQQYFRSNFTTLDKNEHILLTYNNQEFNLVISDTKPSESVLIIDVDLELDLHYTQLKKMEDNTYTIAINKKIENEVKQNEYIFYNIPINNDNKNKVIDIELNNIEGNAVMFVSNTNQLNQQPSLFNNLYNTIDSNVITIDLNQFKEINSLYVSIWGFLTNCKFEIFCKEHEEKMEIETSTNNTTNDEKEIEEMIKKGYKLCNNCSHYIPPNTYDLHTIKCEKLNTKCKLCGELIKKTELANHIHCPIEDCLMLIPKNQPTEIHHHLYHLPHKCYCGEEIFLNDIKKHRNEYCIKRIKQCQFCGVLHEAGSPPSNYNDRMNGYTEHESYCGSKTILCNYCNEKIRLKEIKYHIEIFHKDISNKIELNNNNNNIKNNNYSNDFNYTNNSMIINEWKCGYCSTINSDLNMSCSYCGNDKIKNNNNIINNKIKSTDGYIKMKPETIKRLNSIYCSNLPCRNYKSKSGVAKDKGLCSECYKNIIYPNNDDEEDLETFLYNEYKNQLINGCSCNNKECDNYFCLNGNKNFKEKENEILLLNDSKVLNLGINTPFNVRVPLPSRDNINDLEFLLNNMVDYSVHAENPVYAVCIKRKHSDDSNLFKNVENNYNSSNIVNNSNNKDLFVKSNSNSTNAKKNPFLLSLESKKRKDRIAAASFF